MPKFFTLAISISDGNPTVYYLLYLEMKTTKSDCDFFIIIFNLKNL